MEINDRLIKHHLKNVLFINGTSYAGKSTMVKLIAARFNMVCCGENYDCVPPGIADAGRYPNLNYFETMSDWRSFVSRPPDEYDAFIENCSRELVEFEITHLISIARSQRVIVDTNLPPDVLRRVADYNQVAVMLSPRSMSVRHFFDRDDSDKAFLKRQIMLTDDPERVMASFLAGVAKINRRQNDEWAGSGFFTIHRQEGDGDTREQTLEALAMHFGLPATR